MADKSVDKLTELLAAEGRNLNTSQIHKFKLYTKHLLEKNEVMNLTSVTDPEEIAIKHYYDSVIPFCKLNISGKETLLDIGSGAGFPAIPLKIIFPGLKIIMADSLKKRVNFLNECISLLSFDNIAAIHARAEELPAEMRGKFNIVTARAVAPLNILCEYALPYLKKGGSFIALKGQKNDDEIKGASRAIALLGGKLTDALLFELPEDTGQRSIYIITKISQTPTAYPRKPHQIKKEPL